MTNQILKIKVNPSLATLDLLTQVDEMLRPAIQTLILRDSDGSVDVYLLPCTVSASEAVLQFKELVTALLLDQLADNLPLNPVPHHRGVNFTLKITNARGRISMDLMNPSWSVLLHLLRRIRPRLLRLYLESLDPVDRMVVVLETRNAADLLQAITLFLEDWLRNLKLADKEERFP
jgi:hypothetical protein